MIQFETLSCPSCGGNLKIPFGAEKTTCPYCHNEQFIQWDENSVALLSRKEWICSSCNTAHPRGTRYCNRCGQALFIECPQCGWASESQSLFCANCGINLENAQKKDLQNSVPQKEIPQEGTSDIGKENIRISEGEKIGCGTEIFLFLAMLLMSGILFLVIELLSPLADSYSLGGILVLGLFAILFISPLLIWYFLRKKASKYQRGGKRSSCSKS